MDGSIRYAKFAHNLQPTGHSSARPLGAYHTCAVLICADRHYYTVRKAPHCRSMVNCIISYTIPGLQHIDFNAKAARPRLHQVIYLPSCERDWCFRHPNARPSHSCALLSNADFMVLSWVLAYFYTYRRVYRFTLSNVHTGGYECTATIIARAHDPDIASKPRERSGSPAPFCVLCNRSSSHIL